MQELKNKVNDLSEDIEAYVEAYYELKVLKLSEKASLIASQSIAASAIIILVIFILAFCGIALSWWIGLQLENIPAGFFIVAGVYATLALITVILKKKFVIPGLRNMIIKKMFDDNDN